jgi:hypothetical protein
MRFAYSAAYFLIKKRKQVYSGEQIIFSKRNFELQLDLRVLLLKGLMCVYVGFIKSDTIRKIILA